MNAERLAELAATAHRAIVDQAAGGIFLAGLDGRFLLVNPRWCELVGYEESELLNLTLLDLTFPGDLEKGRTYLSVMAAGGEPFTIDKQYRRKDGTGIWLGVSVSPLLDPDGRAEAVTGLAVDISERKQEESRRAFLSDLTDRLGSVSAPDDIIWTTVKALGEWLGVHRCYFVDCLPHEDRIVLGPNWVASDAPTLPSSLPLFEFGGLEWWKQFASGDFSVSDVTSHPLTRDSAERYTAFDVRSYAVQPFRRDGPVTTVLAVTDRVAREWTLHELTLMQHVVARVWPQVERARAEEALRALRSDSDRRARLHETIMSGTPDLVYTFDLEHRFTYANRALLEMWGLTWDEAIGRTCLELGYPAWHAAMHDREIEEVKRTRQMIRGEVPFDGTNGRRIYDYIFSPVIGADGEVESIAGTTRDVTERHAAEEELRRQTGRRHLLGDSVAVLLTSNDQTQMIEAVFERVSQQLSIDSCFAYTVNDTGDALTLQVAIGISEAHASTVRHLDFGEAMSGLVAVRGEPVIESNIQYSIDPRVARARAMGMRAYACFPLVADGRLFGTLGIGSTTQDTFDADDIEVLTTVSRYVTVASERLRLIRELQETDHKKNDFIALLAHELRNPLAPLRNGLQMIQLAATDPVVLGSARDMMERQLGHMVRLIDDLLDVSRITLNKLTLKRERVTLGDVLMHAVESAGAALQAAGHELVITVPPQPMMLDADLTRMAQVFSNLLSNSAKYTEPGGRIGLTAWRDGSTAMVEVTDNGIGLSPESLPRIFDMFSQIDRGTERTTSGLGIGLALVKGFVELHGGTVSVRSDGFGRGSTFTITLPLAAEGGLEADAATASDAPARAGSRHRILVVDDNRDAADSMTTLLELLGHDVHTAHDGVDAVAAAEALAPHLILMDVGMPRMNGYEATRAIRELPGGKEIMIVAMTGWGQEKDRLDSRDAGCDGHLVKPAGPDELQRLLDALTAPGGAATSSPDQKLSATYRRAQ